VKHTIFTFASCLWFSIQTLSATTSKDFTIHNYPTSHNYYPITVIDSTIKSNQEFNPEYPSIDKTLLTSGNKLQFTLAGNEPKSADTKTPPAKKAWYENIQFRGYTQTRYNRLLETNPLLKCDQCDRSIGEDGGFFIRRLRLIWFGQIHPRVYMYIQPDLASSLSSSLAGNVAQVRDAYFDIGLNKTNSYRIRVGQSKVPFGFENMQSSQNRLNLDRSDAINSALSNERDMGAFFYWAPEKTRKLFSSLVNDGLKGSGDYGVFGFGLYNGQLANQPEANDNRHWVARLSYPFQIGSQIIEPGIQMYSGLYTLNAANLTKNVKVKSDLTYLDERQAATFVLYPKPFGISAEYNTGFGPQYNPSTDSIETQKLNGGYVLVNWKMEVKNTTLIPFARYNYYNGGKKMERDARGYLVKELEFGAEWQAAKNLEIVVAYNMADRTTRDKSNPNNQQKGNFLRIQVQVNY
jgi:hypothetical protein